MTPLHSLHHARRPLGCGSLGAKLARLTFSPGLLLTDGEDHGEGAIEEAKKAHESGVLVFTIGIGGGEHHRRVGGGDARGDGPQPQRERRLEREDVGRSAVVRGHGQGPGPVSPGCQEVGQVLLQAHGPWTAPAGIIRHCQKIHFHRNPYCP